MKDLSQERIDSAIYNIKAVIADGAYYEYLRDDLEDNVKGEPTAPAIVAEGGGAIAVVSDALLDAFYEAASKVIRLRNDTKGAHLSRIDSFAHTALVAINCAIDELEAGGAKCPYNDGLGLPLSTERFFAASNIVDHARDPKR